jgi:hypothetical protein
MRCRSVLKPPLPPFLRVGLKLLLEGRELGEWRIRIRYFLASLARPAKAPRCRVGALASRPPAMILAALAVVVGSVSLRPAGAPSVIGPPILTHPLVAIAALAVRAPALTGRVTASGERRVVLRRSRAGMRLGGGSGGWRGCARRGAATMIVSPGAGPTARYTPILAPTRPPNFDQYLFGAGRFGAGAV